MNRQAILMHDEDDVATALTPLRAGETVAAGRGARAVEVTLRSDVPFGHKFALRDIEAGEEVRKYGLPIGRALGPIGAQRPLRPPPPEVRGQRMKTQMLGYARPDGQKGIRNKVSLIYTVDCSRFVAQKLKLLFPEHTQLFGYPGGCAYEDGPVRKIIALGNHSSSAGALVIGLGCEGTDAHRVADAIAATGRPVERVKINEAGGDILTIEKGSRALVHLIQQASMTERLEMTPADLVVGCECGGSDATSGLASNPLTGVAGDCLIEAGGTYMTEEVSELMGCADVLAARAVDATVAADIRDAIEDAERASFESGRFAWGYGNIQGGLTSIEEKSYGCLAKSGTTPLRGVLRSYGELAGRRGYFICESEPKSGTFHGDPEGINQFAGHGAHLAMFTTGCGSTTGGLIPVIKILANPNRMQLIADNVDFDATPVVRGERTIDEMGPGLYDEILAVARGKLTKSEIHPHFEA